MANETTAIVPAVEQVDPMTLKQLFDKYWGTIKANPKASIGTGLLGAANVAGALDNDKLLGQVAGTALGVAAPKLIQMATGIPVDIGTLGRVNLAMGGGTIGSLFDTLRAKKEQEVWNPDQRRQMPGVIY